jgi:hypothetical protein
MKFFGQLQEAVLFPLPNEQYRFQSRWSYKIAGLGRRGGGRKAKDCDLLMGKD